MTSSTSILTHRRSLAHSHAHRKHPTNVQSPAKYQKLLQHKPLLQILYNPATNVVPPTLPVLPQLDTRAALQTSPKPSQNVFKPSSSHLLRFEQIPTDAPRFVASWHLDGFIVTKGSGLLYSRLLPLPFVITRSFDLQNWLLPLHSLHYRL